MPTMSLTDRQINALQVDQRTEFWDQRLTGLGVRVSPSGRKTFVLMYRAGGRLRRLTLGRYPVMSLADAREEARARLGEVAKGADPAREHAEALRAPTFADLAAQYLEGHAKKKKKTWHEDERLLRVDVLPEWGKRKAPEITRRDARALLAKIVERGAPVAANRVHSLLMTIFNWAVRCDLLEQNPIHMLPKPTKETPRKRVLSGEEIRELWWYLEGEHSVMAKAFRLLLLTAQRSGEVRRMRWSDIEEGTWLLRGENTKSGRDHLVPLSPQVERALGHRSPLGGDIVLESPLKAGSYLTATSLSQAAARYRKDLGWHFTPHDLRRTAATHMGRLGVKSDIIKRVLNHKIAGVTEEVYNLWEYLPEKREALERWGRWVEGVVHGRG